MLKPYLWTEHRARLQWICLKPGENDYNWVFLPGIGLGSEYLKELISVLDVSGNFWLLDLPGDGSNLPSHDEIFLHWQEGLIEALSALPSIIVVAHSAGGMFALSVKEIANIIKGLVLIGSAPDASWQQEFGRYAKEHATPEIEALLKAYEDHPNNETLKNAVVASVAYSFTPQSYEAGKKCLASMSYNYLASMWAAKNFEQGYDAQWIPQIPTLILSGSEDHITPIKLFQSETRFQRTNIILKEIHNAGHFPWVENPKQVASEFMKFSVTV